ncbi:UbiA family prenyltransferase [Streptomyces sp. NBC_00102]|uniref:UbiA family prenyltransferase n=1 Tax=Streptomyces sp. NBC_00102 TaxID=2975652 RepID=UPI002259FD06|nr:UbiA family prenyltransferase [Streptomyces sp. NBC_00102]MCX5398092.1 UbiA family prenyltransferase [Streptomyces sp. NBC_00102]
MTQALTPRLAPSSPSVFTVFDAPWSSLLSTARTVRLCLREARPLVQVMFVLRFVTGALLTSSAAHHRPDAPHLLIGAAAWWAATVSVYVFNGVSDLCEDRANRSQRPLASGRLSEAAARRAVVLTALAGLLLGCAAGWGVFEATTVFLALGYAYSAPRIAAKCRSWSASAVTCAAAGTTYLAGVASSGSRLTVEAAVFALVLSLGVGLIAAVAKDLGSTRGDALAGRRTLAVIRGERSARRFCAASGGALTLVLTVGAVWVRELPLDAAAVAFAVGALCVAGHCRPSRMRDGETKPVNFRGPYRSWMATQYAAHLTALGALLLV